MKRKTDDDLVVAVKVMMTSMTETITRMQTSVLAMDRLSTLNVLLLIIKHATVNFCLQFRFEFKNNITKMFLHTLTKLLASSISRFKEQCFTWHWLKRRHD